ncbi:hypothetical protein AURDEDRAFT_174692 [Auricularia subglabra TFB-10046 SS5]|nr:hypothetical protein AURDEDRAFT_174692 [Auricularia subglabra TFB-10046 SS5]
MMPTASSTPPALAHARVPVGSASGRQMNAATKSRRAAFLYDGTSSSCGCCGSTNASVLSRQGATRALGHDGPIQPRQLDTINMHPREDEGDEPGSRCARSRGRGGRDGRADALAEGRVGADDDAPEREENEEAAHAGSMLDIGMLDAQRDDADRPPFLPPPRAEEPIVAAAPDPASTPTALGPVPASRRPLVTRVPAAPHHQSTSRLSTIAVPFTEIVMHHWEAPAQDEETSPRAAGEITICAPGSLLPGLFVLNGNLMYLQDDYSAVVACRTSARGARGTRSARASSTTCARSRAARAASASQAMRQAGCIPLLGLYVSQVFGNLVPLSGGVALDPLVNVRRIARVIKAPSPRSTSRPPEPAQSLNVGRRWVRLKALDAQGLVRALGAAA